MQINAPDNERPFVETSISRLMKLRMTLTHEDRGISVISGPWGVGKTWSIDAFVRDYECCCAVVKVEPGSRKAGVTPILVMQMVLEAMREQYVEILHHESRTSPGNSYWVIRRQLFSVMSAYQRKCWNADDKPVFTFIFDEAQYLSREAIEMLRFWNDGDRTTMPFPVGLVFVGNNEFALRDDGTGESVLSGAVRSRLLFQEFLQYANIGDADLRLFLQSRGITDPDAIAEFIHYFSQPGRTRDLRHAERQVSFHKRRAGDGPVTGELVRSILNF